MNNMAENGIKVSQIAKDLKVTGKDIVERLAEFGVEVKGTSVLTDEQLGLVFDIYTSLYDLGDEPIVKPPLETEETKQEETPAEEVKQEAPKAEPKKEEPKPQPKKEEKPIAEAKKPAEEVKKQSDRPQEKRSKGPAKKRNEERITPTNNDGEKEYVIKADDAKKVRYVDTRTSTMEIEKVDARERLENMVSDREVSKFENKGKKHNNKKQQGKEKELKEYVWI